MEEERNEDETMEGETVLLCREVMDQIDIRFQQEFSDEPLSLPNSPTYHLSNLTESQHSTVDALGAVSTTMMSSQDMILQQDVFDMGSMAAEDDTVGVEWLSATEAFQYEDRDEERDAPPALVDKEEIERDEKPSPTDPKMIPPHVPLVPPFPSILPLKPSPSATSPPRLCHCKKSRCLKLYCDCFASQLLCDPHRCTCFDCHNNDPQNPQRTKALEGLLSRNPGAFRDGKLTKREKRAKLLRHHRVLSRYDGVEVDAASSSPVERVTEDEERRKGCFCKKSKCLKKYCECFFMGLMCDPGVCHCRDCENYDGSESLVRAVESRQKTERMAGGGEKKAEAKTKEGDS